MIVKTRRFIVGDVGHETSVVIKSRKKSDNSYRVILCVNDHSLEQNEFAADGANDALEDAMQIVNLLTAGRRVIEVGS